MAQVNMPQTSQVPKEDALGTLVKGLQIAQGVYGIRADMALLDKYDREQKAGQVSLDQQSSLYKHTQDLQQGILSPGDRLTLSKDNVIKELDPNDPNQVSQANAWMGDHSHPLLVSSKRDAALLKTMEVADPAHPGVKKTIIVDMGGLAQGKSQKDSTVADYGSTGGIEDPKELAKTRQDHVNKIYDQTRPFQDTLSNLASVQNLAPEALNGNDTAYKAMINIMAAESSKNGRISPEMAKDYKSVDEAQLAFKNYFSSHANGQIDPTVIKQTLATAQAMADNAKTQIGNAIDSGAIQFTKIHGGEFGLSPDESSPSFASNLQRNKAIFGRDLLDNFTTKNGVHGNTIADPLKLPDDKSKFLTGKFYQGKDGSVYHYNGGGFLDPIRTGDPQPAPNQMFAPNPSANVPFVGGR